MDMPFFGLSSVCAVLSDSRALSVFSLLSTFGFSVVFVSCLRFRYSLMDSLRFGVTGGKSFCGLRRGSALCVRDSTFGFIGVLLVDDDDGGGVLTFVGTAATGVDGSLSVE